jgi:hypothetical protein
VWQFNPESAQLRLLFLENASLVASRASECAVGAVDIYILFLH